MHASLDNNHAAAAGTSFFAPHAPLRARFFASFEFVLITLMLTLFTRVGLPPLIVGLPEEYLTGEQGDPFFLQLFYYGCYLTVAALIFRYMLQVGTMLFARPVLLVYIGYILALSLTSDVLSYSLSTVIEYAFATLMGAYIAIRFNYEQYTRILCIAFMTVLYLCLLYAVFLPHIGLQQVGGDFALRGAFQNRNMMAYYMSMGGPLLLLYGFSNVSRYSSLYIISGIIALITIYTSYALTAKIITTAMLFLMVGLSWAERSRLRLSIFTSICLYVGIVVGASLSLYYSDILAFFGKDPSLTGRVAYFARALEEIIASPIFGTHGAPFYIEFMGVANIPANAFSGHLNILMFYGGIGLFIYCLLMLYHAVGAVHFLKDCPGALRLWPLVFLCFWMFGNITESATLGVFFWALFSAHLIGFRTWYARSST